ncbi:unnamed protein product [Diamesa serratosioi]
MAQGFVDVPEQNEQVNEWIRFGMKLAVSSALHPFEYAKVLIQIGFEPLPARATTTLFGRPTLALPNIFQYVGHIKSIDGLKGCYRGLAPKLFGNIVSTHISEIIADKLGLAKVEDNEKDNLTEEEYFDRFEKQLKRDLVVHTSAAIIVSPFHIISVRMMAQFVGQEVKYQTIFGSIATIYKDEGILGFFKGLIPRLVFDLSCVILASTATYYVGRHFIKEKEGRTYFGNFSSFVCTSIFYPLNVVSTCMAVGGSGLKAGMPPLMPVFNGWRDCYNILKSTGDHKRGSSLFFRYIRSKKTI